MKTTHMILGSLLPLFALACAAGSDDSGSVTSAIECTSDADCATAEACLSEGNSSFCRSSCASDADCEAGLECELEHGTSFCKPHGGDGDGGADDGVTEGEECEVEHGEIVCKPHGGN